MVAQMPGHFKCNFASGTGFSSALDGNAGICYNVEKLLTRARYVWQAN